MNSNYISVSHFPLFSSHDYINFLISSYGDVSCVKVAECFSESGIPLSHDTINRFLTKMPLPLDTLWGEVEPFIDKYNGCLVVDDTIIDKPHSQYIELTCFQWSGKHRKVVRGIGLISLVWTDGFHTFPISFRIYNKKKDNLSKNEHLREMLRIAADKGFNPNFVMFDSWYSSTENLALLRELGWRWFARIKKNRLISLDNAENRHVSSVDIPYNGRVANLKKYGTVKLLRSRNKAKRICFWATNALEVDNEDRKTLQSIAWSIENYHRALKELCCIEKCQIRKEIGQRNHILCSIMTFVKLVKLVIEQKEKEITAYKIKWNIRKKGIIGYLMTLDLCALNFF